MRTIHHIEIHSRQNTRACVGSGGVFHYPTCRYYPFVFRSQRSPDRSDDKCLFSISVQFSAVKRGVKTILVMVLADYKLQQ